MPEITVGYWETRDGRKAYVAAVGNPLGEGDNLGRPCIGWFGDVATAWRLDGC